METVRISLYPKLVALSVFLTLAVSCRPDPGFDHLPITASHEKVHRQGVPEAEQENELLHLEHRADPGSADAHEAKLPVLPVVPPGSCKANFELCSDHHGRRVRWDKDKCLFPEINGQKLCEYTVGYWSSTCEVANPDPCEAINAKFGTGQENFNECASHRGYCIWIE